VVFGHPGGLVGVLHLDRREEGLMFFQDFWPAIPI
jgi:hypothetical protein